MPHRYTDTELQKESQLLCEGLAGRYGSDGKVGMLVVSLLEGKFAYFDALEFQDVTGLPLTKVIVDSRYLEVDTVTKGKTQGYTINLIPEIYLSLEV